MVKCSELSKTITEMALTIGSSPKINSIDGVVKEMQKRIPGIDRAMVVDSIVESTKQGKRELSELSVKLSAIKAEARTDKKLQKSINKLESILKRGETLTVQKRIEKKTTEAIESLKEIRDTLKKQIATGDPTRIKAVKEQIANLNEKIESGNIFPKTKDVDTKKSKELERLEFERDELQRDIRSRILELKPRTMWEHIAEPFNTARGIITSMDFSAVFRQGGFIFLGNPVKGAKALGPMFRAFSSTQKQFKINKEILDRPNAPLYRKAKLFIAPIDGSYKLSDREEIMQAKLLDKIPGIAASNRAYTTFLNVLRADTFDTLVGSLAKNGEATMDEAKTIANYVNVATGRGNLGNIEQAALALNTVFFAPRYVASRFQLLVGQPLFGGNARTRKLIAKEYGKFLIGLSLIYALVVLTTKELDLDITIETDPRSSDFGKIKIGNTRVDPLSGISQTVVLLSRIISGKTKSSLSGRITPIRGENVPMWSGGTQEVLARFLRSKLSPMFGKLLDLAAGENVVGEKVTTSSVAIDLLTPLAMREIFDTIKEQGVPAGAALSILSIFGMGIQTYGSQLKSRSRSRSRSSS